MRTAWFRPSSKPTRPMESARRLRKRRLEFDCLEDRLTPTQFTTAILGAPTESPEGTAITLTNSVTPGTRPAPTTPAWLLWRRP
jgi:hypothetical protein